MNQGASNKITIQFFGFRAAYHRQQGHQKVLNVQMTRYMGAHFFVSPRYILHAKKTAFVIEHDFIMATYLADRVIVFEGQPAVSATATP